MSDKICIMCDKEVTHERAYYRFPPGKYVHLLCEPEKVTMRKVREMVGLTQKALAEILGYSELTMAEWDNERSNPVKKELVRRFLAKSIDMFGIEKAREKMYSLKGLKGDDMIRELTK